MDGYLTRVLTDGVELFVRTTKAYEPPEEPAFDFQAHRRRFEEY